MSALIPQFFFSLGFGGIGGFLIGYATKKIVKILMFILGLYLLSLFYLMHIQIITIDTTKLWETSANTLNQIINFLGSTLVYLPISGSFALGFILGIYKG
jgi:uncharacterized membrane protein (Fun14 family)